MIPRARETTCCILLIIFVSYLSHKQLHVCLRVRAILCSPIFASGKPPLEATPSLMAERINVVSYVYHLYLFLRFLFGVNVLGSRCSLFSRFSLFDFPPVLQKNATIHFHGQASPVGVWFFLRLPLKKVKEKKRTLLPSFLALIQPSTTHFIFKFLAASRDFKFHRAVVSCRSSEPLGSGVLP